MGGLGCSWVSLGRPPRGFSTCRARPPGPTSADRAAPPEPCVSSAHALLPGRAPNTGPDGLRREQRTRDSAEMPLVLGLSKPDGKL